MTAITANVPTIEKGRARLGIAVARRFRRKMKITITTSARLNNIVNRTSLNESLIDWERSIRMSILIDGGNCCLRTGSNFLMESATSTVLLPGCR